MNEKKEKQETGQPSQPVNRSTNYVKTVFDTNPRKLETRMIILICHYFNYTSEEIIEHIKNVRNSTYSKQSLSKARQKLVREGHLANENDKYSISETGIKYIEDECSELILQEEQEEERKQREENFYEFLCKKSSLYWEEDEHRESLEEMIRQGKKTYSTSFKDLARFDSEFADAILDKPLDCIEVLKLVARENFDIPDDDFFISILPEGTSEDVKMTVGAIRTILTDKLVVIKGVIRSTGAVMPRDTGICFECPSCSNRHNITQTDETLKDPIRCGCGYKGKFKEISREQSDFQRLTIEELGEELKGINNPSKINVVLKDDLTEHRLQKKYNPGNRVEICGILRQKRVKKRTGKLTNNYYYEIDVLSIDTLDQTLESNLNNEDIREIKKLSKQKDFLEQLSMSYAPHIKQSDWEKIICLLALVGAENRAEVFKNRHHPINILLFGEPGTAKSDLCKTAISLAPSFARYCCGTSSSGVGLTASVDRNPETGEWEARGGALVLAHGGLAVVDELDKFHFNEQTKLNEALAQGEVTLSKATVHTTLKANTCILAVANPKNRYFDKEHKFPSDELELDRSLVDRFDIQWLVRADVSEVIANIHEKNKKIFSDEFLSKYILYARTILPDFSGDTLTKLRDSFEHISSKIKQLKEDRTVDSPPVSLVLGMRQYFAMLRVAIAHAKLRLSNLVEDVDVNFTVSLFTEKYNRLTGLLVDLVDQTQTARVSKEIEGFSGQPTGQPPKLEVDLVD